MTTAARLSFFLLYLTFPFYLFPSGGAQMSTGFALLTLLLLVVSGPKNIVLTRQVVAHLMFVFYALSVNIAWLFKTWDPTFFNHILFTGFAGLTFFTVAALAREFDAKTARLLLLVILVTIVGQLAIVSLDLGRESYRAIGFFNNPNQLSYFAALCAGTALIVGHLYRLDTPLVPLIVLAAVPVSVMSLSRGGTLSCLLYVVLLVFFNKTLSFAMRAFIIVALLAGGTVTVDRFLDSEVYDEFSQRLDDDDIARESEGNRGYARIFNHPENIVWGAGEGGYERFDEEIELHSWPATVLFCYGLIGLGLMARFLWVSMPDFRTALYLLPLVLYNLTHHGGRSLIVWCLLGLIAAYAAQQESRGAVTRSRGRSGSRRRRRRVVART